MTAAATIAVERPLLLASGSPRRRELLERLGVPLLVRSVDVDEAVRGDEQADAYLERIVGSKLAAALALPQAARCAAVLVADTAVLQDGRILGKPCDDADALAMLRALVGRRHQVSTRFAFGDAADALGRQAHTVTTDVWFRSASDDELERYVQTGEGRDKAGSYAVQGIGAFLVERVSGSYTNVVGLPLCEVVKALQDCGRLGPCPMGDLAGRAAGS
jgi:septum formation protein